MSDATRGWLESLVFSFGLFAFTIAEALLLVWFQRKKGVSVGKSLVLAFVPNILSVVLGIFLFFIYMGLSVVIGFSDEPPVKIDTFIFFVIIGTFLFPVILLILVKRLLIRLLEPGGIRRPWTYSILVSISFFMVTFTSLQFSTYLLSPE